MDTDSGTCTSFVLNSFLRQGTDPAENWSPLSTPARRSDSYKSLARRLALQVHPPLTEAQRLRLWRTRAASLLSWLCLCSAPHPPSAIHHSHLCRPCQMVQGVLVVPEGLVVLPSERTGGKRERRVCLQQKKHMG